MATGTPLLVQAAVAPALPDSILSAGDSITRGFDANGDCFLKDCPQLSWSTGDDLSVNSHYARILAVNSAIAGHQYNMAKTGAKMADLPDQLLVAGYFKFSYVTVLMGANDLCTSSAATMTATSVFVEQFARALADYFALNPNGHLFVSSIPDLHQLWTTLHTNTAASTIWGVFKVCQSMLAPNNTDADRQLVVDREYEYNYVLKTVCQTFFANCRWDNYATYAVKFPASDVSTVDYFHPSPSGQANLAAATWKASFWGG